MLRMSKNQVQAIQGAIQMTDRLIALSKEGNYSKSRANSDGVMKKRMNRSTKVT